MGTPIGRVLKGGVALVDDDTMNMPVADGRTEQFVNASVGVYVDFENLVCGAGRGLPGRANPVQYAAITRLCRDYGYAVIRRAYADWANPQFGRYQQDLAMNGVDLIQVVRFGAARKNAADIRMAVDAMETLITHPEVDPVLGRVVVERQ